MFLIDLQRKRLFIKDISFVFEAYVCLDFKMADNSMLTNGALKQILEEDRLVDRPVLQVLTYKQIPQQVPKCFRYSLTDGLYSSQSCVMIGPKLVWQVEQKQFEPSNLIRLNQYTVNQLKNKKVGKIK